MLSALNRAVGALVDGLLWPFQSWPLTGLVAVSLLVALALLTVLRATVDQRGVLVVKRQIEAGLFELRLFRDDPGTVLIVAAELVRRQGAYLRTMLVPLLWMSVPLILVLAQLETHYGYDGLRPGEPALVTVRVAAESIDAAGARPGLTLVAPEGVRVESPGVWAPSLGEVAWRISAEREGEYDLRIAAGDRVMTKHLSVSSSLARRAVVRPRASFWSELRYPAEAPLPRGAPVEAIAVSYPARAIAVLGVRLPWIAIVIVLSTTFSWLCRRAFGVTM